MLHRDWSMAAAFGVAFASILMLFYPASAQDNVIEKVSIAEETAGRISLDVYYTYNGDHGSDVFISAVMAQDGVTLSHYGYRPGTVQSGSHRTRVELGASNSAPDVMSSSELVVSMYVGGGEAFLTRHFIFAKTWSRAGVALTPKPLWATFLTDAGGFVVLENAEILVVEETSGSEAGSAPVRRVLPNGHVQLIYPDGTIRERYMGGETVTHPDGTVQVYSYANAQPPTPPGAPPDAVSAAWLDGQNARLLDILRTLVGFDEGSIDNYLAQEGPAMSIYQRIEARSGAINWLVLP